MFPAFIYLFPALRNIFFKGQIMFSDFSRLRGQVKHNVIICHLVRAVNDVSSLQILVSSLQEGGRVSGGTFGVLV